MHPPNDSLFSAGAPCADEIRRMIRWARLLRDEAEPDQLMEDAWFVPLGAGERLVGHIRAGEVPPLAFEVLGGLCGVIAPQDYAVEDTWEAAWALARPEPGDEPEALPAAPESVLALERELGSAGQALRAEREARAAEEREEERAAMEATLAKFDPRSSVQRRLRAAEQARQRANLDSEGRVRKARPFFRDGPAPHRAVAFRVAPIGAGALDRVESARARAVLWHYRSLAPAWDALRAAFDAVGGASFAGLEHLRALGAAHPASPAFAWLEEVACRVAREDERAEECADRLDDLLGSEAFGLNAAQLAGGVARGRAELDEHAPKIHEAWLWLGSGRSIPSNDDPFEELTPAARASLRRGARAGEPAAVTLWSAASLFSSIQAQERDEQEQDGPLFGLYPEEDVEEAIDLAFCPLVVGFRELYGLELMRDALPKLEAWAGAPRR